MESKTWQRAALEFEVRDVRYWTRRAGFIPSSALLDAGDVELEEVV